MSSGFMIIDLRTENVSFTTGLIGYCLIINWKKQITSVVHNDEEVAFNGTRVCN